MLLIPFVENAFKHGVVMIDNPEIHISLTNQNKTLFLAVRNRYNPSGAETKDASSGIGLENVERRLSLLYEGRHVLQMEKVDSWYIVNLTIELL
jgi:LytS/YehU family sensor histidine kinase